VHRACAVTSKCPPQSPTGIRHAKVTHRTQCSRLLGVVPTLSTQFACKHNKFSHMHTFVAASHGCIIEVVAARGLPMRSSAIARPPCHAHACRSFATFASLISEACQSGARPSHDHRQQSCCILAS
jgi:hypothetical protein